MEVLLLSTVSLPVALGTLAEPEGGAEYGLFRGYKTIGEVQGRAHVLQALGGSKEVLNVERANSRQGGV